MSKTTLQLPPLTDEQIANIESIYPRLRHFIHTLEPVMAETLINELKDINNIVKDTFEARWKAQDAYEEARQEEVYAALDKISTKYKFTSKWSIDEVAPEDLNNLASEKPIKSISYNGQAIKFAGKGKELTWLEVWQHADQLIKDSRDSHHIFIEDFVEMIPDSGYFAISTGS